MQAFKVRQQARRKSASSKASSSKLQLKEGADASLLDHGPVDGVQVFKNPELLVAQGKSVHHFLTVS
jgi:hypothetical protein